MASSTAPNHDFAPAWLKIPSNSQKPSGVANADQPFSGQPLSNSLSTTQVTPRNSSIEPRRERGRSGFPYRHHSIDADDLQRQLPTHSSNGSDYNLVSGFKQHSGSQPSLGRRSNSRQDFRDSSFTSKGSNSFDFSESHRSSNNHWGRQRSFERNHGGSGSAGHNGRNPVVLEHGHSEPSPNWSDKKLDKFDQEFPSLKGDRVEDDVSTTPANSSVWDISKSGKIHLSSSSVGRKIHLVQKPIHKEATLRNSSPNGANGNTSPKCTSVSTTIKQPMKINSGSSVTSVYRTLLPAKGLRRAVNDSIKSNGQIGKTNCAHGIVTPQLEKLNTRLVTHPKNVGNKSDFLKELRDDNGVQLSDLKISCENEDKHMKVNDVSKSENEILVNGNEKSEKNDDEQFQRKHVHAQVNGVDIHDHSDLLEDKVLSRSLEAEQRLLREMGWKEEGSDDEAVYAPLTEDEMKEFRNLPKQVSKKRCNDLPRNFQFSWSPKRVLNIPAAALEIGKDISSSTSTSSDSDSD